MPRKKLRMENPIPIAMIERMKAKFPDFSDIMYSIDECAKIVRSEMKDINFDDRCYLPSYFVTEMMKKITDVDPKRNSSTIFQLASWRQYKQIYSFDADFADILMESATDELIPCEVLKSVPYPSFFVQINGRSNLGDDALGFFVAFDIVGQDVLLDLMEICSDHTLTSVPIFLKDGMSLQDSFKEIKRLCKGYDNEATSKRGIQILSDFASKALQLILYICAVNADICENPEQKSYYRKPSSASLSKDIAREVRKWDVGYRIGNVIRKVDHSNSNDDDAIIVDYNPNHKHTPKRPHMRRGHFHHYWTGSRILGTRKIVLKWLPPQFINASLDELPAVIIDVK